MLTVFIQAQGAGFTLQTCTTHSTQVICVGCKEKNDVLRELGPVTDPVAPTRGCVQEMALDYELWPH